MKKRTNQKCKSVVCAFFVVVADDVAPHRLQGGEKEKKQSQANPFSGDSRTAREPTRRQMRFGVVICNFNVIFCLFVLKLYFVL